MKLNELTMNPSPTHLLSQVQRGLDRYESFQQILIADKDQLSDTVAQIVDGNRHRWGDDPEADAYTGVSDRYIDDLIHYYLTQRRFVHALQSRQNGAWQDVLDQLTLCVNRRLHKRLYDRAGQIAELLDDLVQHCSIVLWERLDTFTFDCSFWAWIEVIVMFEISDLLKSADYRHYTRALRLDDTERELPYRPQGKSDYHRLEDVLMIERLLPELPVDQQIAIRLTLFGYSSGEIAELMDRSVSAVHNLRSRAYRGMRMASSDGESRG